LIGAELDLESEGGFFMKVCSNCYVENNDSNSVCFQCYVSLAPRENSGPTEVAITSHPAPDSTGSSRASSENANSKSSRATAEESDHQRLLRAIERNTQVIEKNLAATRSIAIFIVGWIGWFMLGLLFILFGGVLSMAPDIQILGILVVLGGAILIIVGAVKAIANSLRELARSGD
jgi:cobalamin biosynthesis Mg chelatase CobN